MYYFKWQFYSKYLAIFEFASANLNVTFLTLCGFHCRQCVSVKLWLTMQI